MMKIVKKAKLPKITCTLCRCVYRPNESDLITFSVKGNRLPQEEIRQYVSVNCPVCGLAAYPFREGANDEQRD